MCELELAYWASLSAESRALPVFNHMTPSYFKPHGMQRRLWKITSSSFNGIVIKICFKFGFFLISNRWWFLPLLPLPYTKETLSLPYPVSLRKNQSIAHHRYQPFFFASNAWYLSFSETKAKLSTGYMEVSDTWIFSSSIYS